MLQVNQTGITTKPPILTAIPQLKKADPAQSKNNAGGFSFIITPMQQLERFLIMGSMGGTFYVGQNKLTTENLNNAIKLLKDNPQVAQDVVNKAIKYSVEGRVITNDTCLAILAAASAFGPSYIKPSLTEALVKVARTGTDLLHFTSYADSFRGWGSSLKKIVSNWYLSKTPAQVAFQAVKYFNRDGWTQRDILRKSHTKSVDDSQMNNVFRYITHKNSYSTDLPLPDIIHAAEALKGNPTEANAVALIKSANLPREAIPTELLGSVKVWEALLYKMKTTALVRNLNKMTSIGLLKPLSDHTAYVVNKLSSAESMQKDRIHPIKLLFAQKVYAKGVGDKGSLTWSPISAITDALETAFYNSFSHVKPTGKKLMLGLDISGSMGTAYIGNRLVTCREASFAMAMVTAKSEPQFYAVAFDSATKQVAGSLYSTQNGVRDIDLRRATRLSDYDSVCGKWVGGRTDCSLPMLHATKNSLDVDAFVIYTDNETWAGNIHPHVALSEYNKKMGKNAKLIVVGMTSTRFSIAKPEDPNMLDVVGFDTATPELISAFIGE